MRRKVYYFVTQSKPSRKPVGAAGGDGAYQRMSPREAVAVALALGVAAACSRGSALPAAPGVSRAGAQAAAKCEPVFYKPRGAAAPQRIVPHGPGLVLGGGGRDVNAEFVWIHDTVAGSPHRRAGDLVVLRAYGNNDYDRYIYRLAPFHSVRTLLLPPCTPPVTLRAAAAIVERSTAVFFAGGDQADYVPWKDTALSRAVQRVYDDGGVVGGTSAGEAILGHYVFDARNDDRRDTTSVNAVNNPYERLISFTYDFFRFPPLDGAVADMHFVTRDRFGRTAVFMARQIADDRVRRRPPVVLGIGVDERSGLVVDKRGIATLLMRGKGGSAFLIRGGPAVRIERGRPFVSGTLTVTKMSEQGERFDLNAWCGREPTYSVTVDGRGPHRNMYSPRDPYDPPPGAKIPKCDS